MLKEKHTYLIPYKTKPIFFVSEKTRNKFPHEQYSNIETPKHGFLPLPLEEYPYKIEYESQEKYTPLWLR